MRCMRCGDEVTEEDNIGIVEFRNCSGQAPVHIRICLQCYFIMTKQMLPAKAYKQAVQINRLEVMKLC